MLKGFENNVKLQLPVCIFDQGLSLTSTDPFIASNKLVASLKEELAAQTALAQQTRGLQKKLKDSEAQVKTLNSEVEDLSSQLSRAHTDIKALQTKLAAARNAVANSDGIPSKGAGSAVKTSGVNRSLNGNPEVAQAAQLAQLKEDLYSDLTGLIILDVKKQESNHVYDCIQTGVNGSECNLINSNLSEH